MSKFDNVFKKYLGEKTVTVDTDQLIKGIQKTANDPSMQKLAPVLDAESEALDTDKIHKGLNDVIDPKHPLKFSDVFTNENDKEAALKHLADQGVPIGTPSNQQQNPTNQQNQSQQKTISGSTNMSSANYGTSPTKSSTQGGNLQGI